METVLFLASLLLPHLASPSLAMECANMPPEIATLSRGVDITALDLFPGDTRSSNGFRLPLFEFNCQEYNASSSVAFSPLNFPKYFGELKVVKANGLSIRLTHKDLRDYKEQLSASVGLDSTFHNPGAFSDSASYRMVREEILRSNKSVIEVRKNVQEILLHSILRKFNYFR